MTNEHPQSPASLSGLAINGTWDLIDAQARLTLSFFDAQRSAMQPWLDLQSSLLDQCVRCYGWPGPGSCWMRGTEQLA